MSKAPYLPKLATIEQACAWLEHETNEQWILPRLIEAGMTPYFWLEYTPGYSRIFGKRVEGFLTKMIFGGDIQRLEADDNVALVNFFESHSGEPIKAEPAMPVPLKELRFSRDEIIETASKTRRAPAPEPAQDSEPAPRQSSPVSRFRRLERMDELAEIIFRVLQRWEGQGRKGTPSGGVIHDMILTDESAKGLVTPSADGLIFHGENGDLSMTKKALRKRAGYMAR